MCSTFEGAVLGELQHSTEIRSVFFNSKVSFSIQIHYFYSVRNILYLNILKTYDSITSSLVSWQSFFAVFGIRDILVRIRILLLMDLDPAPDPDLDPTTDPTPFFTDFKDVKRLFFSYLFLITYAQEHRLQS